MRREGELRRGLNLWVQLYTWSPNKLLRSTPYLTMVRGASKIKLKKVNKKRTVTVRRVIIFLNIWRHPLLICLQCCLHQYKTLKAVATATAAIVLYTSISKYPRRKNISLSTLNICPEASPSPHQHLIMFQPIRGNFVWRRCNCSSSPRCSLHKCFPGDYQEMSSILADQ